MFAREEGRLQNPYDLSGLASGFFNPDKAFFALPWSFPSHLASSSFIDFALSFLSWSEICMRENLWLTPQKRSHAFCNEFTLYVKSTAYCGN
jgi:hypothetical protein